MALPDFYIKTGDTTSRIAAVLTDDDGDPVDIFGATVRFHMAPISGATTPVINAAANNDQSGPSTNTGQVHYSWSSGQTATAGLYVAEWQVVYSGGATQTFPNAGYFLVQIMEALA